MYYFIVTDTTIEPVTTYPHGKIYVCRHDWKNFDAARDFAGDVSKATGEAWLAVDEGEYTSPRYDVIPGWKVGEPVSYGFNGDSYPDGTITQISESHRIITTSSGKRYFRHKLTRAWKKTGGTWTLMHGHHNDRNPSF